MYEWARCKEDGVTASPLGSPPPLPLLPIPLFCSLPSLFPLRFLTFLTQSLHLLFFFLFPPFSSFLSLPPFSTPFPSFSFLPPHPYPLPQSPLSPPLPSLFVSSPFSTSFILSASSLIPSISPLSFPHLPPCLLPLYSISTNSLTT